MLWRRIEICTKIQKFNFPKKLNFHLIKAKISLHSYFLKSLKSFFGICPSGFKPNF
jgi:hypothetical protein